MRVKRIGWAGTRTSEYPAMVAFLQAVLGLTTSQEGPDFAAFQLPEGGTFEVFGPRDPDHAHFSTGPVVGFVVDDLTTAVRELEAAGVELLGGQVDERGGGWRDLLNASCRLELERLLPVGDRDSKRKWNRHGICPRYFE